MCATQTGYVYINDILRHCVGQVGTRSLNLTEPERGQRTPTAFAPVPSPSPVLQSSMATESIRNPQGNYTILRIKRKRNEEPLDALGTMQAIIL